MAIFLFNGKNIAYASVDISNQDMQAFQDVSYTQEDVANLVKPSVVRIVQHVKGKITVYPFDIDLKKMEINTLPGKPITQEIDNYISGSGVIINPDGYILTNSHVVSNASIKYQLATSLLTLAVYGKAATLKDSSTTDILKNEEKLRQFEQEALNFLIDKNKFEIEKTLTVLNPSSSKSTLLDLISDGFAVKMISVNDNFYKDGRDAAVIKIEQSNLPSLKLGNSANINTGEKIYIFGYPGSADFNGKNLLEPTFSQGIINGFKNSNDNSFKIFQTDAKISSGSSGGPLLNSKGEIIGLITYASSISENEAGDSFAFAIPSDMVSQIIENNYVQNNQVSFENSNFSTNFKAALAHIQAKKCETALEELSLAGNINEKFQSLTNLNSYQEKCKNIIAAGQSIDTIDTKDAKGEKNSPTMEIVKEYMPWIIAGIVSVIALFVIISIIFLMRKLKKDEQKISELENEAHVENMSHNEAVAYNESEIYKYKSV